MKALVFSSSGQFLGRFDTPDAASVPEAVAEFRKHHPMQPNDYVECDGRTWTLMLTEGGTRLTEGRILRPDGTGSASSAASRTPADDHAAKGDLISALGFIVGFIVLLSVILNAKSRDAGLQTFIAAASIAAFTGGLLYALGVIITGQARILKALEARREAPPSPPEQPSPAPRAGD